MALNDPFDDDGLGDVLIIDPNTFARKLMKTKVEELGCGCIVAADNAADGLAALVADKVDLVIADRRLGMSAIACLLRALRQASEPHFQTMTVLLSTAGVDRAFVDAVGRLGVDGIVVTPCSPRILSERIDAARSPWHPRIAAPPRPRRAYGRIEPEAQTPLAAPVPLR